MDPEIIILDPDITFLKQVVNANLFVQELSVVLDYERISVNASQALTEANKMDPAWNLGTKQWKAASYMF